MSMEWGHILFLFFLIPAALTDFVLCRLSLLWVFVWSILAIAAGLIWGAGFPLIIFDLIPGIIVLAAALAGKGITVGDALSIAIAGCLLGWEESLLRVLAASVICGGVMLVQRKRSCPFLPGLLAASWMLETAGRIAEKSA